MAATGGRRNLMMSGLILAGGRSTRFGRPKALVDIAGRRMVTRVADAISPLADETFVSVADTAAEEQLRAVLPNARFVQDVQPRRGPIEGFREGFRAARGDLVLVAPCDAPLLRTALYRLLLEVVGDADAAVPKFDVFDPVRAVYRRSSVLNVFEATPEVPSPSALVDRVRAVFVDADRIRTVDPDLSSFFDVNTRDDLKEVLRRVRESKR